MLKDLLLQWTKKQWTADSVTNGRLPGAHSHHSGDLTLTKVVFTFWPKKWLWGKCQRDGSSHALLAPKHASVKHLSPMRASISILYAKEHLFSISHGNLRRFEEDPADFLNRSVTTDKTRVCHFMPETKQVKKMETFWLAPSNQGQGCPVTRESHGVSFFQVPMEFCWRTFFQRLTVNGQCHATFFWQLQGNIIAKCPPKVN